MTDPNHDPNHDPNPGPKLDPDLDLVLTREINAPPEVLYECRTSPRHLPQFFVPKPHRVIACQLDVRAGGQTAPLSGPDTDPSPV